MSNVLTVPTHFEDISQLAEGLVERVDENKVILYGPEPFEDGAVIQFAVLLADGSPAFEGQGRVLTSIDGGEERDPATRYDVVIDSLELDGRAEVVLERILLAGGEGSLAGEETGEVAVPEELAAEAAPVEEAAVEEPVAEEPVAEEPVAEEAAAADAAPDFEVAEDEATMVVDPSASDVEDVETAADPADVAPADEPAPEEPAADAGAAADEWDDVGADADFEDVQPPAEAQADAGADLDAEAPADAVEGVEAAADGDPAPEGAAAAAEAEEGDTLADAEARAMDDSASMADTSVERPADRAAPAPPEAPAPFEVARMGTNGSALTRPSLALSWEPQAVPEPEAGPEGEGFRYQVGELPVPPAPVRPDMDPSYRVGPAPHPGAEGGVEQAAYAAPAAAPVADEPPDASEWGMEEAADADAIEAGDAEPLEAEAASATDTPSEPPEELGDMDDLVEMQEEDDPGKEWD
jgi:nicotinate-nucleotide--dimethylbenzimidazole phosphoribosyltransferase